MSSSSQEIVNGIKYAVRARLILRWATVSKHTKCSKHLVNDIDSKIKMGLNKLLLYIPDGEAGRTACVSAGALPILVSLMSSSKDKEAELAVGALANIVSGSCVRKMACVSAGAVPALVRLLSSKKGNEAEWAAGALGTIAWSENEVKTTRVSANHVPALVSLLSTNKGAEAEEAVRALGNITKGDAECMLACVEAGAVPELVKLSSRKNWKAQYAKEVLTNIAKHSPEYWQLVIDSGFNPS